jgi:cytochrome c5
MSAKRLLIAIVLAGVALVAVGAAVVFSGAYNVAATAGHSKPVAAVLETLMHRSVKAHARSIEVPANLRMDDPALAERAISGYEAMCRTCHGAPGRKAEPWRFYPPAPDLTASVREHGWADPEIFWIIKHGIKDTAMPAFGGTHSDEDLWAQTALIRQFQTMTADQYRAMAEKQGVTLSPPRQHSHSSEEPSDGHSH